MRADLFLEVTYRRGRPWAAYLHLPRAPGQKPFRSRRQESGFVLDLARDGTPLGVEITAPELVSVAKLNAVLKGLGAPIIKKADLVPLVAA